jgi:hypothetical protein
VLCELCLFRYLLIILIIFTEQRSEPYLNEHFEFIVEDANTQSVTVKIYDDDDIQVSELIGCAQVSLKDLEPGKVKDVWLKLCKRYGDSKGQERWIRVLCSCPHNYREATVVSNSKRPFSIMRLRFIQKQCTVALLENTIHNIVANLCHCFTR